MGLRNDEKPEGVHCGHVTDEIFRAVTPCFALPAPDEGFRIRMVSRRALVLAAG